MNIVVVEPLEIPLAGQNSIKDILKSKGHEIIIYPDKPQTYEELVNRMKQAEIAIISNIPLSKDVLEQCHKLKFLAVAFSGVDHIDLAYCRENGIAVSNAPGYSTQSVAELTLGLMISAYRSLPIMEFNTRTSRSRGNFLGRELFGKTVGIIGTGLIGSRVAQMALAFGCKVLAYSRTQKQTLVDANVKYVEKDELLSQSDLISLHLPLTPDTTHFIGKDEIMKMKADAVLVNTARGRLIDTNALAVALKVNRIAGAALDVYDREPPLPKESPLLLLQNTVIVPHIGFATHEAMLRRADIVLNNVLSWTEGKIVNSVM